MEASGNYVDISTELKDEFASGIRGLESIVGCIGKDCCAPGTVYDISMGQCSMICTNGTVMHQIIDSSGNKKGVCL